jgi:hypothetical protein
MTDARGFPLPREKTQSPVKKKKKPDTGPMYNVPDASVTLQVDNTRLKDIVKDLGGRYEVAVTRANQWQESQRGTLRVLEEAERREQDCLAKIRGLEADLVDERSAKDLALRLYVSEREELAETRRIKDMADCSVAKMNAVKSENEQLRRLLLNGKQKEDQLAKEAKEAKEKLHKVHKTRESAITCRHSPPIMVPCLRRVVRMIMGCC